MKSVLGTFEERNFQNMMCDLQHLPQISLPRYWFGFKQRPNSTTPSAWREAFSLERDLATDELDRSNFSRFLKLINIAEECGAQNLNFEFIFEEGFKSIALSEIWFPKENMVAMMHEFHSRLKEIS